MGGLVFILVNKFYKIVMRFRRRDLFATSGQRTKLPDDVVPFVMPFGEDSRHVGPSLHTCADALIASRFASTPSFQVPQKLVHRVAKNLRGRLVRTSIVK